MTPLMLSGELDRTSRKINSWAAELRAMGWISFLMALLALFSVSDLFLHLTRGGRVTVWSFLLAGLAATIVNLFIILRRRRSANAVAAIIEQAFPQLDNHLINYVQFSTEPATSSLHNEYVRRGVPEWQTIRVDAMRNRREQILYIAIFLAGIALVTTPFFFGGEAWSRAIRRVINPFSDLQPKTAATILSIQPGTTNIVRGDEVLLTCLTTGRKGQKVELDLWPSDDKHSILLLGRMEGNGTNEFSFRLSKVASATDYRFRAGDAPPSEKYRVGVVPPLAFSTIKLEIKPPGYTLLPATNYDGLLDKIVIPQESKVLIKLLCNQELSAARVEVGKDPPLPLVSNDDGLNWNADMVVSSGRVMTITVADRRGGELSTQIKFQVLQDKPPAIRVIAPTGKSVLVAGAVPRIEFEIADDYGLTRLQLQRGDRSENTAGRGQVLREWLVTNTTAMASNWLGKPTDVVLGTVFRLVAYDNAQPGQPQRSISDPIVFDRGDALVMDQQDAKNAELAEKLLTGLRELQKINLEQTEKLVSAITSATAEQWSEVANRQTEIRRMTGEILKNPRRPLGPLTEGLQRAYGGAMQEVIDVLGRIPKSEGANKNRAAEQAMSLERKILSLLTTTDASYEKIQQHQEITGLLALIDALITGQQEVLVSAQGALKNKLAAQPAYSQQQDKLAADLIEFLQLCRTESEKLKQSDAEFAGIVLKGVAIAESKKIHADMLGAAEQLESGAWSAAVPLQIRALTALKEIQSILNAWRMDDAKDRAQLLQEMVDRNQDRLNQLKNLQSNIVETLRALESQKDKSKKDYDETLEEITELKADMSEAALKIANDLQVFPELPVGNDMVEDVNQIFEEMKQEAGSSKTKVTEMGTQKEDFILGLMEAAAKRFDDMEMWLASKPDAVKRNIESFDKEEMPDITVMPMPTELNDIIGDLLEQQEELKDQADDSAGNQGVADLPMGWAVMEGEWTSYSAKGKSGNTAPDHKEGDGRSGTGREGMSNGESVGGSGKIGEGDKNIEKRMTRDSSQSGQIQEEGHAKAKATGGGKSAGYSEERGMAGQGPRRDSAVTTESDLGLQAMLRRDSETVYAQASLQHIRTGKLGKAIQHMRQAEDAYAKGMPIRQVKEFQRRAIMALKETRTELDSGFSDVAITKNIQKEGTDDQVASTADEAPSQYKELVSEYFKVLGEAR